MSKTPSNIISRFATLCILLLRNVFIFLVVLIPSALFSQSFTEGESLFREDKTELAIPLLQRSLIDGSSQPVVYNYLGISYMKTGQIQKALDTFLEGTTVAGTDKRSLYYNAGTAAYLIPDFEKAKEYFSFAIVADPSYAEAHLNRANTSVQLRHYTDAIDDYNKYLVLEPNSEQRVDVIRMIAALTAEIEFQKQEEIRQAAEQQRLAEEQKRIEEEQKRIAAEQERIAAEQAAAEAERLAEEARRLEEEQQRLAAEQAAAEEARRQAILDALQEGDVTNFSAGSEGGLDYEYEEAELE